MRKRLVQIAAAVSFSWLIGVFPALADPVVVTRGDFTSTLIAEAFSLSGDGFRLSASGLAMNTQMFEMCEPCSATRPVPLSLSGSLYAGNELATGRPGEFNGVDYAQTFLTATMLFISPSFSSAVLSPANLAITAPFSMTGTLTGDASAAALQTSGPALFTAHLIGSGTATAHLALDGPPDPISGQLFMTRDLTYRFGPPSPTPEPSSVLLLLTGIAGALARRWWAGALPRASRMCRG